jgi:hypothetical protein
MENRTSCPNTGEITVSGGGVAGLSARDGAAAPQSRPIEAIAAANVVEAEFIAARPVGFERARREWIGRLVRRSSNPPIFVTGLKRKVGTAQAAHVPTRSADRMVL